MLMRGPPGWDLCPTKDLGGVPHQNSEPLVSKPRKRENAKHENGSSKAGAIGTQKICLPTPVACAEGGQVPKKWRALPE